MSLHKKHNLQAFTQYDSSFESAVWNSAKSVYEIKFARQSDKSQTFMIEAEILVVRPDIARASANRNFSQRLVASASP